MCNEVSIATGADEAGAGPLRQEFFQSKRDEQQTVVPKRGDVILPGGLADDAQPVIDFKTQGPRPNLEQAKSKRDQPSRAPALDFQRLPGFSGSLCQRNSRGLGKNTLS